MAHLVRPVHGVNIQQAFTELNAARNTLLKALNGYNRPTITTACALKRTPVTVTPRGLVNVTQHNYAEVVNQLATMERLLDALAWLANDIKLRSSTVKVCNPTSSNDKWPEYNISNDLIVSLDSEILLFEVSDTEGNQNRKMTKDIEALYASHRILAYNYREVHLYLVCTESSARFVVNKSMGKLYAMLGEPNNTYIAELDDFRGHSARENNGGDQS